MSASKDGTHRIVAHDDWIAARRALLAKEKEFTRLRDELSRARRELPWERVEKSYAFDTPAGRRTLGDLFDGRRQLVVYHFMFAPEATEGCRHCSFWADNFNGIGVHLNHRDVTFVAISRAPLDTLAEFKARMGWTFAWVSAADTDFNYDFQASFSPEDVKAGALVYNYGTIAPGRADREGVSVFARDDGGEVFHTYSTYARGIDMLNTAYHYLDLVPKGRDEDQLPFTQAWVRHHDRYND
jgi:predicted dithiol-disulfide oxidoreductase (DUF899 family)